jgi:hypothetical protein
MTLPKHVSVSFVMLLPSLREVWPAGLLTAAFTVSILMKIWLPRSHDVFELELQDDLEVEEMNT